ncbi:hypothetical protein A176_007522 [Myxococcus hansupus]|uniref:Uncharacterized protein n=1 Tax=Pseudomyxococcus hansupus TaxID=1297742 RepID=A0A0H4XAD7_9BACT|nr:hypothetical protein A176_007522 [Myxococcus hansupus]
MPPPSSQGRRAQILSWRQSSGPLPYGLQVLAQQVRATVFRHVSQWLVRDHAWLRHRTPPTAHGPALSNRHVGLDSGCRRATGTRRLVLRTFPMRSPSQVVCPGVESAGRLTHGVAPSARVTPRRPRDCAWATPSLGSSQLPACSQPVSPAGPNSASELPASHSLVWSSRENICAQLISLLKATPPEHIDQRRRIIWMLGSFGGAEQLPLFRALLLDPNEDFDVRDLAQRAGARHGLQLSARELVQLDAEHIGLRFSLVNLLSFVRLAAFSPDLEAALLQLESGRRGRLLIMQRRVQSAPQSPERTQAQRASVARLDRHPFRFPSPEQVVVAQPHALAEWLFERWYHSDRHTIHEKVDPYERLNLGVALAWKERPEAWHLLTEWCQDMSAEELERDLIRVDWGVSRDELARITRTHPALHRRAAEALLLPLPDLIAHWGEEKLLHRLERVVRAESVACKVRYDLVEPPRHSPGPMNCCFNGTWPGAECCTHSCVTPMWPRRFGATCSNTCRTMTAPPPSVGRVSRSDIPATNRSLAPSSSMPRSTRPRPKTARCSCARCEIRTRGFEASPSKVCSRSGSLARRGSTGSSPWPTSPIPRSASPPPRAWSSKASANG